MLSSLEALEVEVELLHRFPVSNTFYLREKSTFINQYFISLFEGNHWGACPLCGILHDD